ncbi:hypothetical protein CUMW_248800 [Citrus unshiu]|uniref:Uncharacterized protein n=1 Tax=Citrus unshiu TaxID=55188 RepID=A0A2H5QPA5_CITUN|nr:hypothetical protein CUMW_248800 [Citrus unshiu]
MAKTAPEPKRRKINQRPPPRIVSSSTADKARDVPSTSHTIVPVAQTSEINHSKRAAPETSKFFIHHLGIFLCL